MQIIIPMAGQGSRFTKAGYKVPKPLISIHGIPMIEYVIKLFPRDNNFLFICNTEHIKTSSMKDVIQKVIPNAIIKEVKYKKKGPVYGILLAEDLIDDNQPIIVNYCDFNMLWNFSNFSRFVLSNNLDGCIVCYKGFHPHLLNGNYYASVLTDDKDNFLEIKEKFSYTTNIMNSWQSCGTYYFRSGKIMKKYFKELIKKDITSFGEFYVSMVYNLLHNDGLKIKVYPIKYFSQWGTPVDLEEYLYYSKYFKHES